MMFSVIKYQAGGPIDPQFRPGNGSLTSGKAIIEAVEDAERRIQANPQTYHHLLWCPQDRREGSQQGACFWSLVGDGPPTRLGVDEKAVRRMLDPRHRTAVHRIEAALRMLGQELVIETRAA